MKKRNYYYLISGLPEMALDQSKVPLSLQALLEAFEWSLQAQDYQQVQLALWDIDERNFLKLVRGEEQEWEPLGQYSRAFMEEGLKATGMLPSFLARFYEAYKSDTPIWPGLSWENQLRQLSFAYRMEQGNEFLQAWFSFDNQLRNFLLAWNIREYKMEAEVKNHLIGGNQIADAALRSHARDFGLSVELPFLSKLIPILEKDNLLEREMAISRLKWQHIEDLNTFHYFSLEAALGYLLKWRLLNRWAKLDAERGQQAVRHWASQLESRFDRMLNSHEHE